MTDYDWANERGRQWLARLNETEAMLCAFDRFFVDWLLPKLRSNQERVCRIADIACGGGGTTVALAAALEKQDAHAEIHGFDISKDLIGAAKQRGEKYKKRLSFSVMNIETTAPPRNAYDLLVSRFGTMFFVDPDQAFARLARWLVPGGRFLFMVWGDAQRNPWISLATKVARQFIELPPVPDDVPGPFRYANVEHFATLLDAAQFKAVKVENLSMELPLGGGLNSNEAAKFALGAFAVGEALSSAGQTIFDQAQAALADEFSAFEREGRVMLDASVHCVSGCV